MKKETYRVWILIVLIAGLIMAGWYNYQLYTNLELLKTGPCQICMDQGWFCSPPSIPMFG